VVSLEIMKIRIIIVPLRLRKRLNHKS